MEKYLTAENLSENLSVDLNTIYRWARKGAIPGVKIGKYWRFRASDIEGSLAPKTNELDELLKKEDVSFKEWCQEQGIDYDNLDETGAMEIVNKAVHELRMEEHAKG